jgi:hypothetical protein
MKARITNSNEEKGLMKSFEMSWFAARKLKFLRMQDVL